MRWPLGTSDQGLYTREELLDAKWLGHVVVSAQCQAPHLLGLGPSGREDEDRHVRLLPQDAADVLPRQSGEHQVQHHEVWCPRASQLQPLLAGLRLKDVISGRQQVVAERHPN